MKDINRIIKSEVVARVPSQRFRQEYGEVGNSSHITNIKNTTLFTTEFVIKKVIYVTVNGVNLIEGKHYELTADNEISISNYGSAIKRLPGLTTNILVGYYYGRPVNTRVSFDIAPEILSFTLDKTEGFGHIITFDFEIAKNDGRNLYWSILKDGSDIPLFSGDALRTLNGTVVDSAGNAISLVYNLTDAEAANRQGDVIPFTLVLVYDLTEDGFNKDEKCLATATYTVLEPGTTTGEITTLPKFINAVGTYDIATVVNISPAINIAPMYMWRVIRVEGGVETEIMAGNENTNATARYLETVTTTTGQDTIIDYRLEVDAEGQGFKVMDTSKTTIKVPAAERLGRAGFMDANVMFGPGYAIRTIAEYQAALDERMYTLEIDKTVINHKDRVEAPVNNFNGSVTDIFPIFEIPNTWGVVRFNNGIGDIDVSSFSIIDLGNGMTAYLYKAAPSSATNPTLFYIKQ